jgi:hypothetical protein
MASQKKIEFMLGKAILDDQFREKLLKDPELAAEELKIKLTAAQSASIKNLDPQKFEWWAKGFMALKGEKGAFLW